MESGSEGWGSGDSSETESVTKKGNKINDRYQCQPPPGEQP